ncbi:Transmembrane protease serine 6 [Octopus vulgaris]|uniref:Transmembrane protease serine 6 n=1 Tax=Octopus vulgaris TaxID=6645 RepID=A0AA36AT76_OCTVU|nr:Transmembrane protease serine 6 [Octopus vulgaris]
MSRINSGGGGGKVVEMLIVEVSPECAGGVDFQNVLNSFYLNSNTICRNSSTFVNAISSRYCCAFDSISCPVVKQLTEHFYRIYQTEHQFYYLCFYNSFNAISYACKCGNPINKICGIRRESPNFSSNIIAYIIGGREAKDCEFPWMAFIKSRNQICGGSLIDNRHIITAAHCVENRQPGEIFVSLGTNDKEFIRRVYVSAVKINPSYKDRQYHIVSDIAVLTLSEKILLSTCINPVCLPVVEFPLSNTENCFVTGWGKDAEAGNVQRYLHKVRIPIWNNTMCEKYAFGFSAGMLCGGYINGGKDSCGGDSGGPLICPSNNRWVLTGIVSYGMGCSRPHSPGVYTDVRYYLNWIQKTIN